jgi:hypothetical protein
VTAKATPAHTGHRIRVLADGEWRPARCNLNPRQGCTDAPHYVAEFEQRTRPAHGRPRVAPHRKHPCRGCGEGFMVRYGVTVGFPVEGESCSAA